MSFTKIAQLQFDSWNANMCANEWTLIWSSVAGNLFLVGALVGAIARIFTYARGRNNYELHQAKVFMQLYENRASETDIAKLKRDITIFNANNPPRPPPRKLTEGESRTLILSAAKNSHIKETNCSKCFTFRNGYKIQCYTCQDVDIDKYIKFAMYDEAEMYILNHCISDFDGDVFTHKHQDPERVITLLKIKQQIENFISGREHARATFLGEDCEYDPLENTCVEPLENEGREEDII